jgi:hypothetical protein
VEATRKVGIAAQGVEVSEVAARYGREELGLPVRDGRFEATEFAAGNYGLFESALAYERDHTPPEVVTNPAPMASKTPIEMSFKWVNEPSVVYYTLDGSAPNTGSNKWERQRLRGPGENFTFSQTTLVRWLAIDIAGNASTGQARFAVDTNAPTTSMSLAPAAIGGFYKNPSVTLTADDDFAGGGAGVDKTEYSLDGGPTQVYSAPFAVSGDGTHSVAFFSTDLAGNVEATKTETFQIDATKPTISIVRPAGTYALDQVVNAEYTCADALSGVASCDGTVARGSQFDTSSVGTKPFKVDAADNAGNTSSLARTYEVIWANYRGFFQPVDNGVLNLANAGSAIPVKFTLGADYGLDIMAEGYPKSVQVACSATAPTDAIEETVTAGGSSLQFAEGQYHYVWKTLKAWEGTCRQLVVKLRDNTEHRASFKFK